MKLRQPLQSVVDPFVTGCGGELVEGLLPKNTDLPPNADYLFREHHVIAEIKSLENDSFGEPFRRKMGDLMASWQARGLLLVYGTARIDLRQLPPVCQEEALRVIGKPLQDNVLAKANEQIRETKKLLNMAEAKGLLMIASDGNRDLLPHDVWFFLSRLLQKKHGDGRPQYSHIHAIIYFNPRMLAALPGSGQPAYLWMSGSRNNDDREMLHFLQILSEEWPKYIEREGQLSLQRVALESVPLEDITFAGVSRRMPRIQIMRSRRR